MRIIITMLSLLALSFLYGCRTCDCSQQRICTPPLTPDAAASTRNWKPRTVKYHNVATLHPALYLEGGKYERWHADFQSNNWTLNDIWASFYTPASFLAQTAFLPAAAVNTPPWHTCASRGGFKHDQPNKDQIACDSEKNAPNSD